VIGNRVLCVVGRTWFRPVCVCSGIMGSRLVISLPSQWDRSRVFGLARPQSYDASGGCLGRRDGGSDFLGAVACPGWCGLCRRRVGLSGFACDSLALTGSQDGRAALAGLGLMRARRLAGVGVESTALRENARRERVEPRLLSTSISRRLRLSSGSVAGLLRVRTCARARGGRSAPMVSAGHLIQREPTRGLRSRAFRSARRCGASRSGAWPGDRPGKRDRSQHCSKTRVLFPVYERFARDLGRVVRLSPWTVERDAEPSRC
jgi:hypothetical protein